MNTKTITYMSFDLDMTADTTDEEIRSAVEYASIYEYDREDMTAAQVSDHIEDVIAGLIRARNEAFENVTVKTLEIDDAIVVIERHGQEYFVSVGDDVNSSDAMGPFDSADEAEDHARYYIEEYNAQ